MRFRPVIAGRDTVHNALQYRKLVRFRIISGRIILSVPWCVLNREREITKRTNINTNSKSSLDNRGRALKTINHCITNITKLPTYLYPILEFYYFYRYHNFTIFGQSYFQCILWTLDTLRCQIMNFNGFHIIIFVLFSVIYCQSHSETIIPLRQWRLSIRSIKIGTYYLRQWEAAIVNSFNNLFLSFRNRFWCNCTEFTEILLWKYV